MCRKFVYFSCFGYKLAVGYGHYGPPTNPPSLTFARPEQIAKYLVVDQELLQCQIYFTSAMPITKYSSVILKSRHFYPPFTLIPVGRIAFSSSQTVARQNGYNRITNHSFLDQLSIQRFYEFYEINVSSSNDSLDRLMCMKPYQCILYLPSFHPTTKGFFGGVFGQV